MRNRLEAVRAARATPIADNKGRGKQRNGRFRRPNR
jgi:hypothetical protein